jgi:erythronate-4-phosphate dehydrogenase
MKIICANSVSLGEAAFEAFGELRLPAEGEIDADSVREADVVVTRSKTPLNGGLFSGSRVKFAGTCTAGVDHACLPALAELGVHFASAPGCNANAVSEYVLAALLEAPGFRFAGKTVGIIGHGEVGSRVDRKLTALGCRILRHDPPKALTGARGPYVDLDTLLRESDVVTLHVPLVEEGPYPTRGLLGKTEIGKLRSGAMVINACRGEAVDGEALRQARVSGALSWLVLDVWDPEPQVPLALMAAADLATPHIAGHSVEGKVNGTRQIREQLIAYFQLEMPVWHPEPLMPPPEIPEVDLSGIQGFEARLQKAVRACYEICLDDRALRAVTADVGKLFVALRRNYRDRREFAATKVTGLSDEEAPIYRALGFQV